MPGGGVGGGVAGRLHATRPHARKTLSLISFLWKSGKERTTKNLLRAPTEPFHMPPRRIGRDSSTMAHTCVCLPLESSFWRVSFCVPPGQPSVGTITSPNCLCSNREKDLLLAGRMRSENYSSGGCCCTGCVS